MNALRSLLICLFLAVSCAAQENPSADLQRRADQASGVECTKLSMQTARHSLEDANRLFGTGEVKSAHKAVETSLSYVGRSVDCSLQAHKGQKAAEIDLRKLIRRMRDVMQTLDSEDRPHLSRSLVELEKQRDRLLREMFGAAAGGGALEKKP